MKKILSLYSPRFLISLLYMLQSSDYKVTAYLKWFHRADNYSAVMKRRTLVWTHKVKILAVAGYIIILSIIMAAWILSYIWIPLAIIPLVMAPFLLAYTLPIPLLIGQLVIQKPRERKILQDAKNILGRHPAKKIAIVGSYGKTTTKEVLKSVLSEKFEVAATPGNMNTPIGTSKFVQSLTGNEEVLIFEFGESHVGDIKELAELVRPDMGVITGINQAHLESFKTIENTISTIFELYDFLADNPLYVNGDDVLAGQKAKESGSMIYDSQHVGRWTLTSKTSSLKGIELSAKNDNRLVSATVSLIGEHLVGTLLLAVAIGERYGLTDDEITKGLIKIKPFEHRMEPRHLHGALVIDDTYNGNIKGVRAGLKLLKESGAKRRIYVTPGLVETGDDTVSIHKEIGNCIAESADIAVIMKNSVTEYIIQGINEKKFNGEVKIVDDPLAFYTGMEHFVAAGDVVLMQNDWTDNYA